MARPAVPLTRDGLEPALGYLQRAIDRGAAVFSKPPSSVASSFADLTKRLVHADVDGRIDLVNRWVARHVTSEGRKAMLSAMRRRKADAAAGTDGSRTIRITAGGYQSIETLAQKLGMAKAAALVALVQVALADRDLQGMVLKMGVAQSLVPRPKKRTAT